MTILDQEKKYLDLIEENKILLKENTQKNRNLLDAKNHMIYEFIKKNDILKQFIATREILKNSSHQLEELYEHWHLVPIGRDDVGWESETDEEKRKQVLPVELVIKDAAAKLNDIIMPYQKEIDKTVNDHFQSENDSVFMEEKILNQKIKDLEKNLIDLWYNAYQSSSYKEQIDSFFNHMKKDIEYLFNDKDWGHKPPVKVLENKIIFPMTFVREEDCDGDEYLYDITEEVCKIATEIFKIDDLFVADDDYVENSDDDDDYTEIEATLNLIINFKE